jgi:5'-3' exonuclease
VARFNKVKEDPNCNIVGYADVERYFRAKMGTEDTRVRPEDIVALACWLGTDYNENPPGYGPSNLIKYVRSFFDGCAADREAMLENFEKHGIEVDPGLPVARGKQKRKAKSPIPGFANTFKGAFWQFLSSASFAVRSVNRSISAREAFWSNNEYTVHLEEMNRRTPALNYFESLPPLYDIQETVFPHLTIIEPADLIKAFKLEVWTRTKRTLGLVPYTATNRSRYRTKTALLLVHRLSQLACKHEVRARSGEISCPARV